MAGYDFDHMRSYWAHFDLFGLFQAKLMFLLKSISAKKHFFSLRQNHFLSEKVQKGAKRPKMSPNDQKHVILTIRGSFGPYWDIGKPAMFGHSWSQKGHYAHNCT